jgi:hypothetical protein
MPNLRRSISDPGMRFNLDGHRPSAYIAGNDGAAVVMEPSLTLTIIILVVALATVGGMLWLERRKPPLGEVRIFPVMPVMMIAALVVILMLAHLISILTGHTLLPHRGPRI